MFHVNSSIALESIVFVFYSEQNNHIIFNIPNSFDYHICENRDVVYSLLINNLMIKKNKIKI